MPWSSEQQVQYSTMLQELVTEYSDAYTQWTNTIKDSARDPSLQPEANKAAAQVNSIVQKMRLFVKDLQTASSTALEGDVFQSVHALATQIAEEKTTLAKLRSESGTRDAQTNPRATPSPYTNILGLNRVFRDSTRFTIMILSIVFGAFALGLLLYVIYVSSRSPGLSAPPGIAVGGGRRTRK